MTRRLLLFVLAGLVTACATAGRIVEDPDRLCPTGMQFVTWKAGSGPVCECRPGLVPKAEAGCEAPPPPPPPPPPPTPPPAPRCEWWSRSIPCSEELPFLGVTGDAYFCCCSTEDLARNCGVSEPPPPPPPPPPTPKPTPDRCPRVARQGLNLRIHNQQDHVHIHDTTTLFGRGRACNEEHNEECGGRKCEPHDSELRLRVSVPRGLQAVPSDNRFQIRVTGFERPHGSYWLEVCFEPGQRAQAGDLLEVGPEPCTRRTFRY